MLLRVAIQILVELYRFPYMHSGKSSLRVYISGLCVIGPVAFMDFILRYQSQYLEISSLRDNVDIGDSDRDVYVTIM